MSTATAPGVSTVGTTLSWGESASTVAKKVDIKSFSDMGGTPNPKETSTMTDEAQTFIKGIITNGQQTFLINYLSATYASVVADEGKQLYYELAIGEGGSEGTFTWTGEHSIRLLGKNVDDVHEAEITVFPSSLPTHAPASGGGAG